MVIVAPGGPIERELIKLASFPVISPVKVPKRDNEVLQSHLIVDGDGGGHEATLQAGAERPRRHGGFTNQSTFLIMAAKSRANEPRSYRPLPAIVRTDRQVGTYTGCCKFEKCRHTIVGDFLFGCLEAQRLHRTLS
jgi:hypothetical protein